MSDVTGNSGESDSSSQDIPSYEDINDAFGARKDTYEGYHKRIFEYIYNGEDWVTSEEIIQNAINEGQKAHRSKQTKESKIREVQLYDPSITEKIVDKCPPGEVLLTKAEERTGEQIDSDTLNEIQRECTVIGQEAKERYYQYCAEQYRERAEAEAGVSIPAEGQMDVGEVNDLLETLMHVFAENLPGRITEFKNGLISCGGAANELIGVRVLEDEGLDHDPETGDFTRNGSGSSDLEIFSHCADSLQIEVKSAASRERLHRALKDLDSPTAALAFLEEKNASKVRSQILGKGDNNDPWTENSMVAYIPPGTIQQIKELDENTSDGKSAHELKHEGRLYLRANNLFAKDMQSYCNNGELSDVSARHHEDYL